MSDDLEKNNKIHRLLFIELMNDHYYSPQEIQYRIPQPFKNDELLKLILDFRERKAERIYPLEDQQKRAFRYWKTPRIEKMLHAIDIQRSQWQDTNQPALLGELLIQSLVDEAFYSSWIEGAKTTRRRAEELARQEGLPQDRSEQMCLNNFRTMEFILKNLDRKLDAAFICEVHRITTEKTLDAQDAPFAGKYRNEQNYVQDAAGQTIYTPPQASVVSGMMQDLINWTHLDDVDFLFLHPVIKAAVIHFYVVYVHPFFDGNGRTARALMYHYLLQHGYDFMKFFSISKAIAAKRNIYYQSILNVEQNDSDLTYFLLPTVQMILEAITTVETEKKTEGNLVDWLSKLSASGIALNPRQEKMFKLHFRKGVLPLTIKKYQKINRVVYQTARTDLLELCDKGVLKMEKIGREFSFGLKEGVGGGFKSKGRD